MKTIRKLIFFLLFTFAALVAAILVFRNSVAKWIISSGAMRASGFYSSIGHLNLSLTSPRVSVREVTFLNPKESFKEPVALSIRKLDVDYDFFSMLSDTPHLRKLELDIQQVNIVKDSSGRYNFKQMNGDGEDGPSQQDRRIFIDELILTLDRVVYLDESRPSIPPLEYRFQGKPRTYRDIRNLGDLRKKVVLLTLETLPSNVIHTLSIPANLTQTLQQGGQEALSTLKSLIPFGKSPDKQENPSQSQ